MAHRLVDLVRSTINGRDLADDPAELESLLSARVSRASAAWSGVTVAEEPFIRAIAERLDPDAPIRSVEAMQTDDLYLACGCASGDPRAVARFHEHCESTLTTAIASTGVAASARADLAQVVRQRLLVAPEDGTPRIATYSARGSLQAWVRVVAAREALRIMPKAGREVATAADEFDGLQLHDDDPELSYLKRLYREEFKRALHVAIEALDDRERLLLRQHALDGLSIDALAALHGVHRATAARWVDAARKAVHAGTQREMLRHLRLDKEELASVIRMIQSQLDVTLPEALRG